MHHYMYGIVLIIVGLILKSLIAYAIGAGLFIDELAYLLSSGKTHADNYSAGFLIGTCIFVIVIFLLKEYVALPF